jgi:hypothetical protein
MRTRCSRDSIENARRIPGARAIAKTLFTNEPRRALHPIEDVLEVGQALAAQG